MKLRFLLSSLILVICLQGYTQSWDFSSIDFSKADKIARANKGASLDNLQDLVYNLTSKFDNDAERFRAIYMWVCSNVKNDYSLYAKNKRKRKRYEDDSLKLEEWNEKFKKRIFKTLLKRKRTICTGYAYMVKSLSQLADIDCRVINGFGKTSTGKLDDYKYPNHSWNAVKLNDKWYLCDPTWSSGVQSIDNGRFVFSYNDGLFLAPPKLFAINHFPIEKQWFLFEGIKPSFTEFLEAPIVYNEAYKIISNHIKPQKLYNVVPLNYNINFEYTLRPNINPKKIRLMVDGGISTKTIKPDNISIDDKKLTLNYILKKYGQYDIHVKIDDTLLGTYVYKVIRFSEIEKVIN